MQSISTDSSLGARQQGAKAAARQNGEADPEAYMKYWVIFCTITRIPSTNISHREGAAVALVVCGSFGAPLPLLCAQILGILLYFNLGGFSFHVSLSKRALRIFVRKFG